MLIRLGLDSLINCQIVVRKTEEPLSNEGRVVLRNKVVLAGQRLEGNFV